MTESDLAALWAAVDGAPSAKVLDPSRARVVGEIRLLRDGMGGVYWDGRAHALLSPPELEALSRDRQCQVQETA